MLACLIITASPAISSQESAKYEVEEAIYGIINLARIDPIKAAGYLGLDQEGIFGGIAEDSPFWDEYNWSLGKDKSLTAAAIAQARDMLDRNYFGHVSPEGKGPVERGRLAGYKPVYVREEMTLITFQNYISPRQAGLEIFRQFFLDEIQSFKAGKITIFDHRIRDIGLSLQSGSMILDDRLLNVYLFVVQYGISRHEYVEESLIHIINSFRDDPSRFFELHGGGILNHENFPGLSFQSLSPLVFYPSTSDLQWLRQIDKMAPAPSPTIQTINFEQLIPAGADSWEAAKAVFAGLLKESSFDSNFLQHPRANAATFEIVQHRFDDDFIQAEVTYTQAIFNEQETMLMGNVFLDQYMERVFTPEQGRENMLLIIRDESGSVISRTLSGLMGSFRLKHQLKEWNTWEVWSGGEKLLGGSYLPWSGSVWLEIPLSDLPRPGGLPID